MKKKLIALLAVTVIAASSAYAGVISNWLYNAGDSVDSAGQKVKTSTTSVVNKAEADKQSFIDSWKAKRAEAKAKKEAKKAEDKAKRAEVKKDVKETGNAIKKLFTWD